jgi:hypothetical protein
VQTCQQQFAMTQELVDEILRRVKSADSPAEVVSRVVDALIAAEVDLREAPSLEQMKRLLVEAFRSSGLTCPAGNATP